MGPFMNLKAALKRAKTINHVPAMVPTLQKKRGYKKKVRVCVLDSTAIVLIHMREGSKERERERDTVCPLFYEWDKVL